MSFIVISWLVVAFSWAVLSPVFTSSNRVRFSTFALDAFVLAFPFVTWGPTGSDRAVSEFTFALAAYPLWTAAGVIDGWSATTWAFGHEINLWTKFFAALALRPAAVGIIRMHPWFEAVVLWTASWSGWDVSDRAAVFTAGFTAWTFVFVTATAMSLFDKNSSDFNVVASTSLLSWASFSDVVKFLKLITRFTPVRPAIHVEFLVDLEFFDNFTFIVFNFTSAFKAWDWIRVDLVFPAVVPHASGPVFPSFTWLKNLVTDPTSTFFEADTSVKVRKDLTSSALSWFVFLAEVDAVVARVLALAPESRKGVASVFTLEGAKLFLFFSTWSWGAWSSSWIVLFVVPWSSGDFWLWSSGVVWAWKIDAPFFTLHTVARLAFVRKTWDLFAFSIPSAVNFFTEAFSSFNAFSTVFRKNGIVNALATFNANLFAFFLNDFPFAHVRTSPWARADAWIVFFTAIALHWAHTLMSPRDVDTLVVTSLSVSTDSGTETFAFATSIASARVALAVFKEPFWVDKFVTSSKNAIWIFNDGAFFAGPSHPVWVKLTSVWRVSFLLTGLVFPPRVSKIWDNFSWHTVPLEKITSDLAVVVTAETFKTSSFVFWIDLDDHVGTFIPHKSDTDISFDKDPKTGKFKGKSRISAGSNWSASDQFDRGIANSKSNVFSTNGTFRTTSFIRSSDLKDVLVFSVDIFANTGKLVLSVVKSDNMGITIDFALLWAGLVVAFPRAVGHAGTVVTVVFIAFAFNIRFTAVVAWAVTGFNTSAGNLIEHIAVFTLTAADAMVIKVFRNSLGHVHVPASSQFWPLALSVFFVSSTSSVDVFTFLVSTFPSTFMALADVAVLSPRFTSKVLPIVEETRAFSWSDTLVVVVKNLAFWALTAWDALFMAVFKL
jgi:hypothetical protein